MTESRKLAYDYLNLSYDIRSEIAKQLGVMGEFRTAFARDLQVFATAKEQNRVAELREAIDKHLNA